MRRLRIRKVQDERGVGAVECLSLDEIGGRIVASIGVTQADTAVIRSIVSLADELQLDVVAECVETSAQHVALARLGCVAAPSVGFPYPHDEAGRLEALHHADVLDTPAEEVYDEIVRAAAELCGTPISLISLIDEDRQWFKAKVGLDADQTPREVAFCAHAICSEEPMEVPDARDDDRFASNPLVLGDPNVRFYAGVPLSVAAGYSYGTLCVIDTVPRVLTLDQRNGLSRLARQATVLLELRESINRLNHANGQLEFAHRKRDAVEARLRHQAHYDPLTGLPNRALLMSRIETALDTSVSTGRPVAMLICDLDDFKLVNDGLGHSAGDQLLVEVARRLRTCVRETDTVARFGGDTFVMLINNTDEQIVAQLGERILDAMSTPISIGGRDDIRSSISIGVAAHTPGDSGGELLSNADAAMYRAKALGGGRMCRFDATLRTDIIDRLTITTEFQTAVTNGELFCLHQPEIDLVNGQLFGLESLVRWHHPTRGVLLPGEFVPILEATHGTDALFEQVLHLTMAAQSVWAARLGQWPAVAVNLSARQLDDSSLADTVRSVLAQFSAPPESLWLEVTESALASTPTFETLDEIHRLGVRLAIDDFGVGWSSMARLSSFPWDVLKIDRTFVEPLGRTDNADHVVRAIISLAHSLGMRTTAEGVETVDQLHRLIDLGCDIAQGYLIDRPLPASEALQRMTLLTGPGHAADLIGWSSPLVASVYEERNAFNNSSWE